MIVVDRREAQARWLDALDRAPDGLAARLLSPVGALYAAVAALHRGIRGEHPLPSSPPSIAIGNLRVGGTGKTPIVHDLGRRLLERGHRVAVLSRGYRSAGGGDEPAWLEASGLHVVLDADRRRGFEAARAQGADVVLLDDGLQTRARASRRLAIVLERDLRRVPRPLPAGPAREGRGALARADAFLVRRDGDTGPLPPRPDDGRPRVGFRLRPRRWLDAGGDGVAGPDDKPFDGPVVAVSGLARPESFETTLRQAGVQLRGAWRGPDHWDPSADEVSQVAQWARSTGAVGLVCPEKNLQRLARSAPDLPLWSLAVEVAWDVDDPLGALGLDGLLERHEGDTSVPPSPDA